MLQYFVYFKIGNNLLLGYYLFILCYITSYLSMCFVFIEFVTYFTYGYFLINLPLLALINNNLIMNK